LPPDRTVDPEPLTGIGSLEESAGPARYLGLTPLAGVTGVRAVVAAVDLREVLLRLGHRRRTARELAQVDAIVRGRQIRAD
jgi:hypothetical protein